MKQRIFEQKFCKHSLPILLCLSLLVGCFLLPTAASAEGGLEIVVPKRQDSVLTQTAEALLEELALLPATGRWRNGKVQLSEFSQSADGSKDVKELRGKHYIVRYDSSPFALDGSWTGSNGELPMKAIILSGYSISSGAGPSAAFEFIPRGIASNGKPAYVLRFHNGRNLAVGTRYSGWPELSYVKADTTADVTKAPAVLFDHPDNAGWFRISDGTGKHGFRQSSDLTCFRWKDNSAGDNDYLGNTLELYRLWSTEELAKQIHAMKVYLELSSVYEEGIYSEFLTCMRKSIDLFKKYYASPTGMIEAYDFIQETLDKQTAALKVFASKLIPRENLDLEQTAALLRQELESLPTTGALRNGKVNLSSFSQSADGSKDMKELKGKYYLLREEGGAYYALDGSWTGTDGNLPLKNATISGNYIASGVSPNMAFAFHYRGTASNGMPAYVLRFNNGRNLGIGTRYTNWPELYNVKGDTTADLSKAPQIRIDHPNGGDWFRISNITGSHGFRQDSGPTCFRWKDNSAGDNAYQGNALTLYRFWSTRELIAAIHDMKGYLDTPEFFDEEVFTQFLTCMRESVELFRKYNPWPSAMIEPYEFIQESLDQKEAELRGFASRLSFEAEAPPTAQLNATTKIHQLPTACGYIIQTRENKIIIVDGGWRDNNTEGTYLFSYLQKITGDATPHINAWFITHAHADHHGCVPTFADLYKDRVTIDAFYYHYPTYEQIGKYLSGCGVDDTWGAVDWLPTWLLPNFKNAEGGPTKGIICNTKHSGLCNNSFDFDEVHIDILLTFEDVAWAADNVSGRYSGTSANEGRVFSNKTFKELLNDNFNETSMVFRVTVGGKNVLFTGDINYIGGYMLNKFHDAYAKDQRSYYSIKSDYVQVSHHGHYGLPKNSYTRIDPDVAMWPCNYDEWNDYDYQNLICTKQWFNDMGAKSYVAYQGPQVFEFPTVRSEGAVTIPAELKDYVFRAEYYSAQYPDLAQLYGTDAAKLYYHFLNYGIEEGRSASPFFDVKFYANQNGAYLRDTVKGNYLAAFRDFLSSYRSNTLRKLSELFDASVYADNHKELAAQGYTTNFSLLKHYVDNGYQTGEIPSKTFFCADRGMSYHDNCTVTQAVAPTCTSQGKTAGIKCNTCGSVLEEQKTVPQTGHKAVEIPAVEGDCLTEGRTAGTKCEICGMILSGCQVIPAQGHKPQTLTGKSASCTTEGLTDGSKCGLCGEILKAQEAIPPTGHKVVEIPEIPGDCLTEGRSGGTQCETCGLVLSGCQLIPAEGHQIQTVPGKAPGCTDSGLTEGQVCGRCGEVLREQQILPRLGHDYVYRDLGQSHELSCTRCSKVSSEAHSFDNGLCICGAADKPTVDESIVIGHSLNLASDISVNYAVQTSLLEGYDSFYLECVIPKYTGNVQTGVQTLTIQPVLNGSYYYFTLDGMTAVQMNDTVEATLYMTGNGKRAVSKTDVYSVATYAYNQLNKPKASASLKSLCAELLRYGATAQSYKGYRTAALADSAMTADHRALLRDPDGVSFGNFNTQFEDMDAPMILWAGKALSLDSKVTIRFIINTEYYVADLSNLSLRLSYRKADGTVGKATLTNPVAYSKEGLYVFDFDGLMAAELRTVINAAVYAGNTQVSNTLQYSADTYGNGKSGTLLALCKALFAYSDSAKAYFLG